MLDRIKGEVVFTCDDCEEALETCTDDFAEARAQLKAERWKISKNDVTGAWEHHCPSCKPTASGAFARWMD